MKVRFNLGAGDNYMKWKVSDEKSVEYIDPHKSSLSLVNCRLVNRPKSAEKIHQGANKFVCAWIECDWTKQIPIQNPNTMEQIFYNPKIRPHWHDKYGNNIDGKFYSRIITIGEKVFVSCIR